MAIKSARLKRIKLTVQQNTPTRDGYGDDIDSWATYCERHAEQLQLTATENFIYMQRYATKLYKYKLRYDNKTKDITPSMRVMKGADVLEIISLTADPNNYTDVIMMCKEVQV